MKTYSEACDKVLVRKVEQPTPTELPPDMQDRGQRYGDLHAEVQASDLSEMFVCQLISSFAGQVTLTQLLKIALSHGVMVGIEMEKIEVE